MKVLVLYQYSKRSLHESECDGKVLIVQKRSDIYRAFTRFAAGQNYRRWEITGYLTETGAEFF